MAIKVSLPILGQPNPDEPKDVHLVGRYALGVTWADTREHLSLRAPAPRRSRAPARAGSGADPGHGLAKDIKKQADGLRVTWSDGHQSSTRSGRSAPCAGAPGCTGRPLVITPGEPHRRLVVAGVMASMFLAAMESTVVATAMPTVIASLGGIRIYSWTFSASSSPRR